MEPGPEKVGWKDHMKVHCFTLETTPSYAYFATALAVTLLNTHLVECTLSHGLQFEQRGC